MTPAQLRTAGRELYGENWQTPLAQAIDITARSVRRYAAGDQPIPLLVFLAIVALLAEHRGLIRPFKR